MDAKVHGNMAIYDNLEKFEKEWNKSEKMMIRAKIMPAAAKFLEDEAFNDFRMKKGAVGMELTKLLLIARDCLKKNNDKDK